MTLQEADEDRRVARSAMRGILIAASNLHAAGSADLMTRAEKVAVVAATHAASVDRRVAIPQRGDRCGARRAAVERSGAAANSAARAPASADIVDVCYMLGRNCASTAMIYAMHQTKVACLVRHGRGSAWHQRLLRRLCAEQLLLASSTTEGRAGGDVRNSAAPIEWRDSRITLERQATVISYAEAADGIVTTARRSAGSGELGPGAGRLPQRRLRARAAERLGCVRHARHLQRRLHALCLGFRRADPAGELRQDSRPDHDAVRASGLERRLGRHRRRGGRSRARFRAQGHPRRRRHAAARRRST